MTFRSPWIDPRVLNVRAAHAQAYLLNRGWKQLPKSRPHCLTFDGPFPEDENVTVFVPTFETASDYTQRVIELITAIANVEQRYAHDVVTDMLMSETSANPVNGSVSHPVADAATS